MVMWIYAIVLSIVGLFALCSLSLPKANLLRRVLLIATLLVLVLFMGFRDRVGADWDTYQAIFDAYSGTGLKNPFTTVPIEPGYAVLNYISASLSTGIYLVNFVCAAIMIGALARFAYLVDVDAILVLFLALPYLVFVVGMGYTRQATAIGLACTALGYWVREERAKFCLTAILATTFHYSAVFLLLLVWIKNWRRVVLAIPLAFIGGYLFLTMVYMHYFAFYVQNTVDLHSSGVWFRLAIVLLGVILTIAQRRRWREEPRLFGLLKGGSAIALSLIPLAIVASTLADRICLYLFFIYLVTFARALRFSPLEIRHPVLAGMYIITYAWFFAWFLASAYAASSWIPYRTILLDLVSSR